MNDCQNQVNADAMKTPSQIASSEQPKKKPKCANYFEYRSIPHESGLGIEPLEDQPDTKTEVINCPVFKQIETVQVSAPIPENSNFFEGVNPSIRDAFGVNGSIHLSRGPVERVVRTSYRVITPEVQEPSIIVYQNNSPPESFFHEVRPVTVITSVQAPAKLSYRAPQIEIARDDPNAEIHRKFQIINALNRIESDTKAMAIKQKRIEVMGPALLRNSGVFVDESNVIINQLAEFKLELNGLEDDTNRLGQINLGDKLGMLNRVNDLRAQIDFMMQFRPQVESTVGLRNSNILMNESIVSTSSSKKIRVSVEPVRRPGSIARVVSTEPRVIKYVNSPVTNTYNPIVMNETVYTNYLPSTSVVATNQVFPSTTVVYNDIRQSQDRFVVEAQPRVVRYSYNPNTYISNVTTNHRVTQTVEQPTHVVMRETIMTLPMSDIRESLNEHSFKSSAHQQLVVPPELNDSRRRVTIGVTNSISGRNISHGERTWIEGPVSIKSIERQSVGSAKRIQVLNSSFRSSQNHEQIQTSSNR